MPYLWAIVAMQVSSKRERTAVLTEKQLCEFTSVCRATGRTSDKHCFGVKPRTSLNSGKTAALLRDRLHSVVLGQRKLEDWLAPRKAVLPPRPVASRTITTIFLCAAVVMTLGCKDW